MKIDDCTSADVHTHEGGDLPPCAGLTPNAFPEVQCSMSAESSQTGVSTRNALCGTTAVNSKATVMPKPQRKKDIRHWYALRCTYGREQSAYDYLVAKGITAFYPTTNVVKRVNGKRIVITESRLPNIFFAFGTEEELKTFVYDNVNLPYLRFYYSHHREGTRIVKEPLVVPDYQIEGLKIICASETEDIIIVPSDVQKFKTGQTVRVTEGVFKGGIGKVSRYQGQQRVAIIIDGLLTIASAYVPKAFIESIV